MSDLISRRDAIEAVVGAEYPHKAEDGVPIADGTRKVSSCVRRLKDLPSAQPKQGKWIGGELGYCTCCGHEGCASDIWNGCETLYCPACGARILEEDE